MRHDRVKVFNVITGAKPPLLRRYVFIMLAGLCVASVGGARAAGMAVSSQRITVSQSATSVSCVVNVSISNNIFTPSSVIVTPGCSVKWTNTVTTQHSSTSNSSSGNTVDPWDSGLFRSTSTPNNFTKIFNTPGTYNYFCSVHRSAGMTGTITVNP